MWARGRTRRLAESRGVRNAQGSNRLASILLRHLACDNDESRGARFGRGALGTCSRCRAAHPTSACPPESEFGLGLVRGGSYGGQQLCTLGAAHARCTHTRPYRACNTGHDQRSCPDTRSSVVGKGVAHMRIHVHMHMRMEGAHIRRRSSTSSAPLRFCRLHRRHRRRPRPPTPKSKQLHIPCRRLAIAGQLAQRPWIGGQWDRGD